MTIWLLAILLLGSLVAIGYTQGAIRVGISFIGILIAALLAAPLGKLARPALSALGVANPVLLWALAPLVAFIVVNAVFKVIALAVHKKVDVFYKYKAGDLRLALWERLNARLGACLGVLNGIAYLVLIAFAIYPFSYWTVQIASEAENPKTVRLLNRLGQDLNSTGFAKAARAIDPLPSLFYEAADMAGLLFQNSLLEARLSRYPAFLTLAEKPEFQGLGQDKGLSELRLRRAPLSEVLANPSVQTITQNPDTLKLVWNVVTPDIADLRVFLETGISQKYDEKILGRWTFDVNAAVMAFRKSRPNLPSGEMLKARQRMTQTFAKTLLVAAPDGTVYLKNYPKVNAQGTTENQNIQGTWKATGSTYAISLGSLGERRGKLENGRLALPGEDLSLMFIPED